MDLQTLELVTCKSTTHGLYPLACLDCHHASFSRPAQLSDNKNMKNNSIIGPSAHPTSKHLQKCNHRFLWYFPFAINRLGFNMRRADVKISLRLRSSCISCFVVLWPISTHLSHPLSSPTTRSTQNQFDTLQHTLPRLVTLAHLNPSVINPPCLGLTYFTSPQCTSLYLALPCHTMPHLLSPSLNVAKAIPTC